MGGATSQELTNLAKKFGPFCFLGFLKTTDQPTTYHLPPTNRPPTKCTDQMHRPTDHGPIRNMRTITNFKLISDKKT